MCAEGSEATLVLQVPASLYKLSHGPGEWLTYLEY